MYTNYLNLTPWPTTNNRQRRQHLNNESSSTLPSTPPRGKQTPYEGKSPKNKELKVSSMHLANQ